MDLKSVLRKPRPKVLLLPASLPVKKPAEDDPSADHQPRVRGKHHIRQSALRRREFNGRQRLDDPHECLPLIEALAEVKDSRRARGTRHSLPAILALAVVPTLCATKRYCAIAEQGRHHGADRLRRLLAEHALSRGS